ncbi:MAG: DNA repair protein RecN [Cytophagaceae bacterium]
MLKNLLIKNYALIKHLEISPSSEFNIITGETGAGKSIMLGALGLLMGNRADTKVLLDETEKCIIEAAFDIASYKLKGFFEHNDLDYEQTCLIRREISPGNKSRAFINDTPVTLEVLKTLGVYLMDIHSQHETLLLGNSNFQLMLIDSYAGNTDLLSSYKSFYREYIQKKERLEKLTETFHQNSREKDFNDFLFQELSDAGLLEGEQEKLEDELRLLENAEEIKLRLGEIRYLMQDGEINALQAMASSLKNLENLSSLSSSYEELNQRLHSCYLEAKDITDDLSAKEERIETSQERIEVARERLNKIYSLQKKHAVNSIAELIGILNRLEKDMVGNNDLEEEINNLKLTLEKDVAHLTKLAGELSSSRKSVFTSLTDELKSLLAEVGIAEAGFIVDHMEVVPGPSGADQIKLLFSANKGIKPQELKNAASGGEFSRLMLCLKYILAGKTSLPTIIFDEIDTGISGEVAIKVGRMMKQMSQKHQILAITHLPQMAAIGAKHYYVYKDNSADKTVSSIRELSEKERVMEIAQMIGGANPSETTVQNARELLEKQC